MTYRYPGWETPALRNVSLSIAEGKTVLFAGRSGGGKSTILRLMNGLLLQVDGGAFEGSVQICGRDAKSYEMWELAKVVGTVFQNPKSQFFNLDTTDEVVFGLESMGASHAEMEERLSRTSEDLDLAALLDRSVFELSGGEA